MKSSPELAFFWASFALISRFVFSSEESGSPVNLLLVGM